MLTSWDFYLLLLFFVSVHFKEFKLFRMNTNDCGER